jgi:hypothetical protein
VAGKALFSCAFIHRTHIEFLNVHSPSSAAFFAALHEASARHAVHIFFVPPASILTIFQRLSAATAAHDAFQREALGGGTLSRNSVAKTKRKTTGPK